MKVILYKNSINSLRSFHDGFVEIRFTASEINGLVIVLSVWLLDRAFKLMYNFLYRKKKGI